MVLYLYLIMRGWKKQQEQKLRKDLKGQEGSLKATDNSDDINYEHYDRESKTNGGSRGASGFWFISPLHVLTSSNN